MFIERPIKDFLYFFDNAMLDNKHSNCVDRPNGMYRDELTKYYTDTEGALGYGIAPDNEITNIFKHEFVTDALKLIIPSAIYNKGTWLTCFEGPLSDMYGAYGFQIVNATEFCLTLSPANWNTTKQGQPRVVTMRYIA